MSDPITPPPAYAPRVVPDPAPASPPAAAPKAGDIAFGASATVGAGIATNDQIVARDGSVVGGGRSGVQATVAANVGVVVNPPSREDARLGARGTILKLEAAGEFGSGNTTAGGLFRAGLEHSTPTGVLDVTAGLKVDGHGLGPVVEGAYYVRLGDGPVSLGGGVRYDMVDGGTLTAPGRSYEGVDYQTPDTTSSADRHQVTPFVGAKLEF
jgi:hypothetical protein